MCDKKESNLIPPRQKIRSIQSRPIILNRRSLSSSSIPRKKRELELPCTSRDESHILHLCHDIPEPFNSQTVPLPSHKLLIEDVWNVGDGYVSAAYPSSASNSIQQPYNLISGHQQLPFFQQSNALMASNPYIYVDNGASAGQRSTKPLAMYNASVNSAYDQNLIDHSKRRIVLPDMGEPFYFHTYCTVPRLYLSPIE